LEPQLDPRPLPVPEGFEDFYRASYRELVKHAMFMGADVEEAKDAAAKTLEEMLRIWPVPGYPLQYARKAVFNNFIKAKERGKLRQRRVAARLVERGHVSQCEDAEDEGLGVEANRQWVADVLSELPPAQREVMQLIADGLTHKEIAETLNISGEAVRRRLCDARARLTQLLNPDGEFKQPRRTTALSSGEEAR
jgi:RNA polymerase sigma factor (sigma-70 family)